MFPLLDIPTFLVVLGPLLWKGFLGLALSGVFGITALGAMSTVFGTTAWGSCSLNIKNILSVNTLFVLNILLQ